MKRLVPGFFLCWVLASTVALAQEDDEILYHRAQGWSLLAGDTVGAGHTVASAQVGWPGLSLGLLHGATSRLDLGGRFTFNYGQEGVLQLTRPGFKFQGWGRLMLARTPEVSLAFVFQPGLLFYFHDGDKDVGLALPVSLVAGIPVGSAIMLNLALDVPFQAYFGSGGGVVIPLMVGGGLEYFFDRSLQVNFNVRMGPSIFPNAESRGTHDAYFTLEALVGVAWRF